MGKPTMRRRTRLPETAPARRPRPRGFVTLTVLIFAMMLLFIGLLLVSNSLFEVKGATRSQNRIMALMVAEAGVDDAVAQISSNPDFAGRTVTLYEDPGTNARPNGRFTTAVVRASDTLRRVTSVGTSPGQTAVTVVATVVIDTRALGNAAIMANGPINIGGTLTVNSTPTQDLHISHVYGNGDVSMGGSSYVDGVLMSAGNVTGQAYFPSQSGVAAFPYPSTTQTDQWHAEWIAAASAGGSVNTVRRSTTITAPKYINGDITLSGSDNVTLSGSGVIYVNGNVNLTAQSVLTNGVTLVVRGTFNQQGQSVYKITTGLTPTPTLVVYGTGSGATADVVGLTGGSLANQQGIIYAVNGNIKVAGGSVFVGALVAGGAGSGVNSTGNYAHWFPEGMAAPVKFPTAAQVQAIVEP
jgi:Tfp pilus assembly protein PilX